MWDVYAPNTLNQITGIATVRPGKTPKPIDWHPALSYDLNRNLTQVGTDGDTITHKIRGANLLLQGLEKASGT